MQRGTDRNGLIDVLMIERWMHMNRWMGYMNGWTDRWSDK